MIGWLSFSLNLAIISKSGYMYIQEKITQNSTKERKIEPFYLQNIDFASCITENALYLLLRTDVKKRCW